MSLEHKDESNVGSAHSTLTALITAAAARAQTVQYKLSPQYFTAIANLLRAVPWSSDVHFSKARAECQETIAAQ